MPTEDRIETLIKAMTLEEKVRLCSGADNWHTRRIDRLGIPPLRMTDGPHGTRTITDEEPRTTIPSTCFPTGSALAATWNTELMERVGVALADETKAVGCHILLGPAVNIHRSPLGGRNFEYYSEDPHLAARMGVAWIKGLQSQGVGASLKHFACNNSEFERMTISSEVDERTLHEIYYPAFKAAVCEAQPWTVMSSYNRVNGVSSAHRKPMLTDLLKDEWGFTGFVVSDWGGVYDRVAAANGGCDVEMPYKGEFQVQQLLDAVKKGEVSEQVIDDKARRVLRIVARAGLFDYPPKPPRRSTDTPDRRALAREAAAEAIVLLKNTSNALPLDGVTSLAVIGHAGETAIIQGGGSARVTPHYAVSPLDGLRARCGKKIKVAYERGCSLDGAYPPLELDYIAEYHDNPRFGGKPVATQQVKSVTLDLAKPPDAALAAADFSVQWQAEFTVPVAGVYRFSLSSVGLSSLLVDGRTVVNNWKPSYPRPFTPPNVLAFGSIRLNPGAHTILVEYSRDDEAGVSISVGCAAPNDDALERAAAVAAQADAAVVCVGLPDRYESEGYDRPDMELTGDQVALIKRVAAANKRTIVVVHSGNPVNMSSWIGRVPAVVAALYTGQEMGNALADVLFGDVNPSGKLPTTFPKRLEDTPTYVNYPGESDVVRYGEGIFVGYRYYDQAGVAPLFPFGHGLSYTTFAYGNLTIAPQRAASGDTIGVSVDVTNTGTRAGKEVVQLYLHDVASTLPRPPKELKGFRKVALRPGETKTVTFTLTRDDLAFYDPVCSGWVAEAGKFQVLVGSSSRDIRFKGSFTYDGDPGLPRFSAHSRLSDVLSHKKGRAVMRAYLGDLRAQGRLRWVSSYTLDQLARFTPEFISQETLQKIEADLKKIR
jgi:beta-glucosidase